jgi:hypothetical protein
MTKFVEFSLPTENYLEYLRLLRSHGIAVANNYARLVTRKGYRSIKKQAGARLWRAKR